MPEFKSMAFPIGGDHFDVQNIRACQKIMGFITSGLAYKKQDDALSTDDLEGLQILLENIDSALQKAVADMERKRKEYGCLECEYRKTFGFGAVEAAQEVDNGK
jgi:hypothetical protein